MVPFVVKNYNAVEIGPRGTGKSHLFQQISPYSHLVSGGKATVANMFVNMNSGRRGLVAQYDVICFDEVSGISFDQKEGVNILKGYMESGEFSRGRESIRADGGIVLVGNFDVDVDHQLHVGHLLSPLPKEMRDDTAFMDRIHAYLPGWDVPKLDPSYFTDHFGLVSDFLAEVWSQLRRLSRLDVLQGRLEWGHELSGRDRKAANNTVDGLLRLLYPNPEQDVPDDALAWAASLALEMRRRVKEAQSFIGAAEFGAVNLSFRIANGPEITVFCNESVNFRLREETDSVPSIIGRPVDGDVLPAPDPKDISSRAPSRDYSVGDTIGDRFQVESILGSGGFSKVYRVMDVVESEVRALKLFDNAAGYEAVRREIGALRKVHHPNVVQVLWADKTDSGEWYLVMEFIDGELLADYTSGRKHLRDREAIDVALDVLSALEAIHPDGERLEFLNKKNQEGELTQDEFDELTSIQANALVHRDIKPHNIMLTRSGAKLLDFNISSRVGDPVHTVSGTPPYQPPDANLTQWDVSTDLFAVGVTLYELLCDGEHPYPQARPTSDVEPRDPRVFRKVMNANLAEFLIRACATERSVRFHTAREMRSALEDVRVEI
jgi:tRNA A-37 threonylcarbamoyl transferase component Bud32